MAKFKSPIQIDKPKTVTYNLTVEQIEQIRHEGRKEGMRAGSYIANAMYSVAMLLALRDLLGFGRIRLSRIFKRVQQNFAWFVQDELAYSDGSKALLEECGINLVIERPNGTPVNAWDLFRECDLAKSGYNVKLL